MSEKDKQGQHDQSDICAVFDNTIGLVRDNTQRVMEAPTGLDEEGRRRREESLRSLGETAISLLEQRRSRFEEKRF